MGRTRKTQRASPKNDQQKLDTVLALLARYHWSLHDFFVHLFGDFSDDEACKVDGENKRTKSHAAFVANFMREASKDGTDRLQDVLTMMYNHSDGIPTQTRATSSGPAAPRKDHVPMARYQMLLWATQAVQNQIARELDTLVDSDSGLRLPADDQNWETVVQLSLPNIGDKIMSLAPTVYELVLCAATSPNADETVAEEMDSSDKPEERSRDPRIITVASILMICVSRNRLANLFQKTIGVWLFSCSASSNIYRVLCRLGLAVSYTTIFRTLVKLARSSMQLTKEIAQKKECLLIIDNIDRQRKFWAPSLGQQDIMMSGTAATLVELVGCPPGAFDPKPVLSAQRKQLRQALTPQILYDRLDQDRLTSVMALHCLKFLVSNAPTLSHLSDYITCQFRTTYAIHRMPSNTKTNVYPLSTSGISEGSAAGCRDVMNNIWLHQLGLPEELVSSILRIIGGDLGTIEKLRALKVLESSCPHGYPQFAWILPLVQLWHMGWADLARIINNFWGKPASSDPSSLWRNCELLGRKVKPGRRPDYYPAHALVLDTLEADVLDCWRLLLNTKDLEDYFSSLETLPTPAELLTLAEKLVMRWASTHAHDIATHSDTYWDGPCVNDDLSDSSGSDSFVPLASRQSATRKLYPTGDLGFRGDHCLANGILRMRDLLWHLEWDYAIADGDIGRAMQIMAAWQFTFVGGVKGSKYATELLTLSAEFLYEFPPSLQEAVMNNWLCNLSGLPGCWFPMDLMQEHHIRELKTKSQRRDEDFSGEFFQDVVARNVRWFSDIQSAVNLAVGLQDRSAHHSNTKRDGAANRLRIALEQGRIHTFMPGRSHGWVAKDNFVDGIERMPHKLARFLRRSANGHLGVDPDDMDTVGDEMDEFQSTDVQEDMFSQPPLPPMVIDGQLVPGDMELDEQHVESLPVF
ncbi:hypothetical protein FRC12_001205 [Ceratobasidium sp. 428]|nr:hypothetical protein FRC12_001205 [Ceratobasidium sp. 428]